LILIINNYQNVAISLNDKERKIKSVADPGFSSFFLAKSTFASLHQMPAIEWLCA